MFDTGDGFQLQAWLRTLFPICRSLTGEGLRETLRYLQQQLPELTIHAVPSGTAAFDWTVPEEWNIRDGFVADESGQRIIDFRAHNLHVMGYSEPVGTWLSLEELERKSCYQRIFVIRRLPTTTCPAQL